MSECIHGFGPDQCATCSAGATGSGGAGEAWAGKSFALVYVPGRWPDAFVHLNREGDHWKFRHYPSPHVPAVELAQSGASAKSTVDLATLELFHETSYPYSTSPGGVSIRDSRYWFDEIAKLNERHGLR